MNNYEYVGSVMCSGTLDNGEKWSGLRVCLALLRDDKPFTLKVFKVARSCSDLVQDLGFLERIQVLFDEKGRIADVIR